MPLTLARLEQGRAALIELYRKVLDPAVFEKLGINQTGEPLVINDEHSAHPDSPDIRALKASINLLQDLDSMLVAVKSKSRVMRYGKLVFAARPFLKNVNQAMNFLNQANALAGVLTSEQQEALGSVNSMFKNISLFLGGTAPTKKGSEGVQESIGSITGTVTQYITPAEGQSATVKILKSLNELAEKTKSAMNPDEVAQVNASKKGNVYKTYSNDETNIKSIKAMLNATTAMHQLMDSYTNLKSLGISQLPALMQMVKNALDTFHNLQEISYSSEFAKLSAQTQVLLKQVLQDINPLMQQLAVDLDQLEVGSIGLKQGTVSSLMQPIFTRLNSLQERFEVAIPANEKAPFSAAITKARQDAWKKTADVLNDYTQDAQGTHKKLTAASAILKQHGWDNLDKISVQDLVTIKAALPYMDCHPNERKQFGEIITKLITEKDNAPLPPPAGKWGIFKSASGWVMDKLKQGVKSVTGTDHTLLDQRIGATIIRWEDERRRLEDRRDILESRMSAAEISAAHAITLPASYSITTPQEKAEIPPTMELDSTIGFLTKINEGIRSAIATHLAPEFLAELKSEKGENEDFTVNDHDPDAIKNVKILLNIVQHSQQACAELNDKTLMNALKTNPTTPLHLVQVVENLSKLDISILQGTESLSDLFSARTTDIVQACANIVAKLPSTLTSGRVEQTPNEIYQDKINQLDVMTKELRDAKSVPQAMVLLGKIIEEKMNTLLKPEEIAEMKKQEVGFAIDNPADIIAACERVAAGKTDQTEAVLDVLSSCVHLAEALPTHLSGQNIETSFMSDFLEKINDLKDPNAVPGALVELSKTLQATIDKLLTPEERSEMKSQEKSFKKDTAGENPEYKINYEVKGKDREIVQKLKTSLNMLYGAKKLVVHAMSDEVLKGKYVSDKLAQIKKDYAKLDVKDNAEKKVNFVIQPTDSPNVRNAKALQNIVYASKKLIAHFFGDKNILFKTKLLMNKLSKLKEAYAQLDFKNDVEKIKEMTNELLKELSPLMLAALTTTDKLEDQQRLAQGSLSKPLEEVLSFVASVQEKLGVEQSERVKFPFKEEREQYRDNRIQLLEMRSEAIADSEAWKKISQAEEILSKFSGVVLNNLHPDQLKIIRDALPYLKLSTTDKQNFEKTIDDAIQHHIDFAASVSKQSFVAGTATILASMAVTVGSQLVASALGSIHDVVKDKVHEEFTSRKKELREIDLEVKVIKGRDPISDRKPTAEKKEDDSDAESPSHPSAH